MFSGSILHEDFKGHKGEIQAGGIQWMTAGKGIKHAEMPSSKEIPSVGTQLWINLPAKDKYTDPNYQEFEKSEILEIKETDHLTGSKYLK